MKISPSIAVTAAFGLTLLCGGVAYAGDYIGGGSSTGDSSGSGGGHLVCHHRHHDRGLLNLDVGGNADDDDPALIDIDALTRHSGDSIARVDITDDSDGHLVCHHSD